MKESVNFDSRLKCFLYNWYFLVLNWFLFRSIPCIQKRCCFDNAEVNKKVIIRASKVTVFRPSTFLLIQLKVLNKVF